MEDLSLRAEFHRALDPVATPGPWLSANVREALRSTSASWSIGHRRGFPFQRDWVIAVAAVLVAVSIVAGLLIGSRILHRQTVPVKPPTHQVPGSTACLGWGPTQSSTASQPPIKMTSPTIGWAAGAQRTTDGGAHWTDTTPPSFMSDAPNLPGEGSVEPPAYAAFFLDSDHAWLARTYGTVRTCLDRIQTLSTSDGGSTWSQGKPIPLKADATGTLTTQLDFLDDRNGWLLVGGTSAQVFTIYSTKDGGRNWALVTSAAPICPRVVFASTQVGWSTCSSDGVFSPSPQLSVTRDGGESWTAETLPSPPGGCPCATNLPVFADASHGVAVVLGYSQYAVVYTTDAGQTWHVPPTPAGWFPAATISDPGHYWLLEAPPSSSKGGPDILLTSSDGGFTWSIVDNKVPAAAAGVVALEFVDAQHGFVIQSAANQAWQLLVTSDGGRTWTVAQPVIP